MTTLLFHYVTGGTLAPDAPSYIERQADADLLRYLLEGKFCYVLNSRQMGKSSLCVRTMGVLRESGCHTAFVDLTKLGGKNITPEQWYVGIANEIGRELGLRSEFIAYWKQNSEFSPIQRLFGAIRDVALEKLDGPLAIFVDEIDATRSLSFSTDEFFAAIREGYNRRVQDPALHRLTFCLLGVAVPSDLINSPTSTPFNIGERIHLQDFTLKEAVRLASGLGRPGAEDILRQVHHWTNGQPFLTQSLCAAIAADATIQTPQDVDAMVRRDLIQPEARETNINLADVANRALHAGDLEPDPEKFRADLLSAYERAWRGKPLADDEANRVAALLKLSGIMRSEGNQLKVRNRIYESVFGKDWIAENMPGQEKRRQKRSFWTGVLRTAFAASAVVAIVSYFAVKASQAQHAAEAAKKQLDYQLYVANMNVMQLYEQEGNRAQMAKILDDTRDSPYRGWEWGYWNGVLYDAKEEYVLDSSVQEPIHYSSLSSDAKQIMIPDRVLGVATLVDRRTKQAVGHYSISKEEMIYPVGGRWLAFANDASMLTVRELISGRKLFEWAKGTGQGGYLYPDPVSGLIHLTQYSKSLEGVVKSILIDPQSGEVVWKLASPAGQSKFIQSVSKDRLRYLVGEDSPESGFDAKYSVLDRNNRVIDQIGKIKNADATPSLSPSGRLLCYAEKDRVIVRDVDKRRTVMAVALDKANRASFDPTERYLVCSHQNGRVTVRSIPEGTIVAEYRGAEGISLSDTTPELVLCGKTIRVVPLVAPKPPELIGTASRGTRERIVLQSFTRNSYEFRSEEDLSLLSGPFKPKGNYLLSLDGRLVAAFEDTKQGRMSVLRDVESGTALLQSKQGWVQVAAPLVGDEFVALSADGTTLEGFRWGSTEPRWSRKVSDLTGNFQLSADGRRMLAAWQDRQEIWDGETGKVLKSLPRENDGLSGFIGQSSDFWVGDGGKVDIYDGVSLARKLTMTLDTPYVTSLQRSPDGSRILIGDWQGGVSIWDATTLRRLTRIQTSEGYVSSLLFTRDGKKLLVGGGNDETVTILESKGADTVIRIKVPAAPEESKK